MVIHLETLEDQGYYLLAAWSHYHLKVEQYESGLAFVSEVNAN